MRHSRVSLAPGRPRKLAEVIGGLPDPSQQTILDLMGIPPGVYANFTPEQKQFAQEMLDVMHPMTPSYKGTINDADMLLVDKISVYNLTAPALIIHAKDDALVNECQYRPAEVGVFCDPPELEVPGMNQ